MRTKLLLKHSVFQREKNLSKQWPLGGNTNKSAFAG